MATTADAPMYRLGLRMLGNETAKGLRVMWAHKAPLALGLAYVAMLYWVIQLFIGGGRLVGEVLAMTFVAFLGYVVLYIASLRMVSGVLEEMYTGTLEQSLLSPLRPWVASTGRLAAALVEGLVIAAIVAGFNLVILLAVQGVELSFRWSAVVPLAVTLVDIAGFVLLFGGMALVVNSVGAIIHVVQNVIMMLNGAFIPVFVFPDWLELAAKIVVPTTLGLDATRQILVAGAPLDNVWSSGTLPWAVVHAAVQLVVGWAAYQAAIRRGLREGRLGA
ncbi:ABC-2 type transport system permease protein [Kribbella sp. VKM Ac-2527]|uniref:ABC-2 type transport system permease protein n=1 Tax=Kribbella caucasensis TaxID=2512215 RepID=A0A4R6J4S8_9ACTN|nr:ABC transporter permease [Kribbella sp. VKM Ac-2527]TDO30403.1 ABC-2 type transport system permease protein [Kribbella sp. VKM Ac-2527]